MKRDAISVVVCLAAVIVFTAVAAAETVVKAEYGEAREGTWKFPNLTGPSRSDLAQQGTFTVVAGDPQKGCAPVTELNDGVVANNGEDARRAVFFAHHCPTGGALRLDLGSVQPIRQVNSFSFHTWGDDQGGRTPQVYTLSGSVDGQAWVKIADVDSRPNTTGEKWGNRPHGVQIAAADGQDLGRFRYLLWEVKPTRSPLTAQRQGGECWSNTFYMELDVHSAATLASFQPATLASRWPNLEEIIICWKTHLDIGYTDTIPSVIDFCRRGLPQSALRPIEATRDRAEGERFVWMLPSWAMSVALDKAQIPELLPRVERAVRERQLIWHALPFTMEADALDVEELVRCFGYDRDIARRFGLPRSRFAKCTDVPSQSWIMPTLLAHAGVTFLHMGCNPVSARVNIPSLSWWEGPDGSRVLLGFSGDYGWGGLPPADWPYKTWLIMRVEGEGLPSPSLPQINEMVAGIQRAAPGTRVRFGSPEEFADRILQEHPDLPVIRGDMPDTWAHGLMTEPEASGLHRQTAMKLSAVGLLDTELRQWSVSTGDLSAALEEAYRQGGFYGEHTWGLNSGFIGYPTHYYRDSTLYKEQDLEHKSLRTYRYGEEFTKLHAEGRYDWFNKEFDYHPAYARRADAIAEAELAPRLALLARSVACDGPRVVVFNPLPTVRSATACVELPADAPAPGIVRDAVTKEPVPFALTGRQLRLSAKELPAGGYRAYQLQAGPAAPAPVAPALVGGRLSTEHFIAIFDLQRGGISSLVERATGRELVDSRTHVLGQFLHQRFSKSDCAKFCRDYGGWGKDFDKPGLPDDTKLPHLDLTPGPWSATVEDDPIETRVVLAPADTLGLAGSFRLSFAFPKAQPCVDIGWQVKDKVPNTIPEGGWLCVPAAMPNAPSFRVGRIGGTVDPAKDIVAGANRHLLCVERGISVRDAKTGEGLGVASETLPLWSLGEPGLWRFSRSYVPEKPELFVNLYNNMWNTNYRLYIEGSWSTGFRLWPVAAAATEDAALCTPAMEVRQAALAASADGAGGSLPPERTGVSVSRTGVRVSAFAPNPDGDGALLRVWEQAGRGGPVTVSLPASCRTAQPVNLRGEPCGAPLEVRDRKIVFDLPAYSPASFVLQ